MKIKAKFILERTTTGAVRYQEVDDAGKALKGDADGAKITTLYLRKAALGDSIPNNITVEITA